MLCLFSQEAKILGVGLFKVLKEEGKFQIISVTFVLGSGLFMWYFPLTFRDLDDC